MEQMDVITAFFYGFLEEDIFVNQRERSVIDAALIYHLQKALYGLKQAPRIWYSLISKFLQGLGYMKTNANYSIFVSHDKSIFISVYVDKLFIIGEDLNIINSLNNKLSEDFCMTNLGLVSYYLGMSVTRIGEPVCLNQKSYMEKVLLQFRIDT